MWRIVARAGQMGYPVIIKLGTLSVGPNFIVGKIFIGNISKLEWTKSWWNKSFSCESRKQTHSGCGAMQEILWSSITRRMNHSFYFVWKNTKRKKHSKSLEQISAMRMLENRICVFRNLFGGVLVVGGTGPGNDWTLTEYSSPALLSLSHSPLSRQPGRQEGGPDLSRPSDPAWPRLSQPAHTPHRPTHRSGQIHDWILKV